MSALVFWVDGRSHKLSPSNTPRSLRIKFEEVIDHATARHNARRKIVREDSDRRRLIIELEQIVVHACWELLRNGPGMTSRFHMAAGDGSFRHATNPGSLCRFPTNGSSGASKTPSGSQSRERLQSLSWFMKCFKEPLARLANRQDKVRGAFFEQRFKSVAILDEESLLATCAYIDLNPVAAGIAETPETSPHTSVSTRVEHVKAQGRTEDVQAAAKGSAAPPQASAGLEESIWLCPIEDRSRVDSARRGMLEGFSLGSYLLLVDYTGCLFREGKAAISAELAGILERLGSSADRWRVRLEKLKAGRLLGRFFAATRARLREVATALGVHHLANLEDASRADATSCPAPTQPVCAAWNAQSAPQSFLVSSNSKISAACALCRPRPAR